MSRAGYSEDIDQWQMIRWRGQVASAISGQRGQSFLRELIDALDALPEKRLIAGELQEGCNVCAIGSVGARRGVDMTKLDPHDAETLSGTFGIAQQLVREIEFMNDEGNCWEETPEQRWTRMRHWAVSNLTPTAPPAHLNRVEEEGGK
jgi:hypothetical protein